MYGRADVEPVDIAVDFDGSEYEKGEALFQQNGADEGEACASLYSSWLFG